MLRLLVILPILLAAAAVQTLSIDSRLGTSVEDCFDRVSIGERLPLNAIYRNVSELTTRECEQICKNDKQCQVYDYGVRAKGNATCDLSRIKEKDLKPLVIRHPDFDIYIRRVQCEQSPPLPFQPSLYEGSEGGYPEDGQIHRPVHRPEAEDPRRPVSDHQLADLRPYETNFDRPHSDDPEKPFYDFEKPRPYFHNPETPVNNLDRPFEKPDTDNHDYNDVRPNYAYGYRPYNEKPIYEDNRPLDLDAPSYGGFCPQSMPSRPEYDHRPNHGGNRPQSYKPQYQNDQYRPIYGHRPDKYDVLHFQGQYRPPYHEENYRPDPYLPQSPDDDPDIYGQRPAQVYRPERPEYDNANRPITPHQRPEYNGYRPQDPIQKLENYPIRLPNRPNNYNPIINHEPNYYNQESNHIEPSKPYVANHGGYQNYGGGLTGFGYGYGNHHYYQNRPQYSQLNSQHAYGTITEIDGSIDSYRPQKPDNQNSYITVDNKNQVHDDHTSTEKPENGYNKPANHIAGNNQNINNLITNSNQSHITSDIVQFTTIQSILRPQNSYVQSNTNKPSTNYQNRHQNQPSYAQSQPIFISNYRPINQKPYTDNRPNDQVTQKPYDDNQYIYGSSIKRPVYSENRPISDEDVNNRPNPSYDNRPNNQVTQKPYNDNQYFTVPLYSSTLNRPVYSVNRPISGQDRPITEPSYSNQHNNQVTQKPYNGYHNRPLYGGYRPISDLDYINDRPDSSYDNQSQVQETSGYGSQIEENRTKGLGAKVNHTQHTPKPQQVKPVYEYHKESSNIPSYNAKPSEAMKPSGAVKPSGEVVISSGEIVTSRPMVIGDYGGNRRPFGNGKPLGKEPFYEPCFRRVLAGKRTLRSHVRRVVPCERLEDCRRECTDERRFHCESFNYKLDPTFRGKGICELMTKPIEAFNIRRDFVEDKNYDFYEIDRNSLEPHCLETLKGPGRMHSGYLTSKSSNSVPITSWASRADDFGGHRDFNRDFNNRGYDRFDHRNHEYNERRRYPQEPYVPYQIGQSCSDDQDTWGQYGGVYGGYEYYKNRNDYTKSMNHWRLNDIETPVYGVKPYGGFNYNDLGKNIWDRYGGSWKRGRWESAPGPTGMDYGESNYYNPPRHYESAERPERRDQPDDVVKDCTSRRRPGMSLGSGSIRRALLARNVVDCESACFNEQEFRCVSYSFRYSNSHGTDNCFLSERPYRGLDLNADSGSDVYAMQDNGCSAVSHKPWVESECFWHVRSGAAITGEVAKAAITAAGLGACEAECIRAQGFFCRGFSFRYDSPVIGDDLENCILTSSPPTSLDTGRGIRPITGHELYARGNYGRGCEPALYDDVDPHQKEYECYLQYDNAAKLLKSAIKGQAHTKDEESCGRACTDAPFRCLSFSYNNNAPPGKDNCLLSEIRLFDLQRGVDYEHSADDWLFAFDLFNSKCHRKVVDKGGYEEPIPHVPHHHVSHPTDDTYHAPGPSGPPEYPSGPGYTPYSETGPGFKPSHPGIPYLPEGHSEAGSGFKPGRPYLPEEQPYYPSYLPPKGPSYLPEPGFMPPSGPPRPVYGLGEPYRPPEHRPDLGHGGEEIRPIGPGDRGEPIAVSHQHYTVSGFPCRKGTTCAQNQVAGHWACEPEGGEIGSWDYCCAPTHRCGYSEGFHKPWCYVGPAEDQWRPCSEKYYPYHQHSQPHPSQGHIDDGRHSRPWQDYVHNRRPSPYLPESDRRYWDDLYKNGPKAYYDQCGNPLPGYTRVPMAERPQIKYHHNYPQPGGGPWVPVHHEHDHGTNNHDFDPSQPELGVARYWPVAYLHKGPPPNMTYFNYNHTHNTTTEKNSTPQSLPKEGSIQPFNTNTTSNSSSINLTQRDEKTRNMTDKDLISLALDFASLNLTNASRTDENIDLLSETLKDEKLNDTEVEMIKPVSTEKIEKLKGISGKIDDFSESIEILDIEDAKKDKKGELKTLEAEERQIEAIGRLLASRRDGKLVIEKRSQKELESKNIALDNELLNFNFGNKFPANERRGIIQKVTKEEIEKEKNTDQSLELSETTFVRPPRILSTTTTEKPVRKAVVNGKIFYDATIKEQKEQISPTTVSITRKPKNLRPLEEKAPTVFSNSNSNNGYGRKNNIRARNVNPVRKVRRVYRRRYNPEEVRKRLLEKKNKQESINDNNDGNNAGA